MHPPKWLRILIPTLLVILWFAVASIGGPTFGKLGDVTSNDQASFLPASADSTQAQNLQTKFNDSTAIPAIVIVTSKTPIQPTELGEYAQLATQLKTVPGIEQSPKTDTGLVIGPIPSKDRLAVEYIVPISASSDVAVVVQEMRTVVNKYLPAGTTAYVSGPAGLTADLVKAFGGIDGILLLVAVSAVFIILLIVYRSLLLPFLVLFTSLFALCAAILVVYLMAKHGIIKLNGQSQGILSILVIGAATDYSLLLVSRYREALREHESKWEAIMQAVRRAFEPIAASAATVILALLCLLFSDLNSNRSLGPIAATGIVFAFLAAITLLPALLYIFGRVAFWPSKITYDPSHKSSGLLIKTGLEESTGIWKKVGSLVAGHARAVWILTTIALALGAAGLLQLKADGVSQTDIILTQSDAVDGQVLIAKHFDAGAATPVSIIAPVGSTEQVVATIKSNPAFSTVSVVGGNSDPKVVDGQVLIKAGLKTSADSAAAEASVRELRAQLNVKDSKVLVGGTTAIAIDTNDTARADLIKIVPIVLVVILLVLMLLLRSIVAPLLLIGTVILSFAATLGISALVFNHLFHFPGADATVPLFGFIFLVALGIDYNIFLMTRAREEAFKYGTRPAMLHALGKTGGVITSAGIVLAATFAALAIIPILFLAQIAFIVAFGVLIDTIIVRSLLVPALVYDIGAPVWWPSRRLKK